ncbi:hypothetical protein E4U22_001465 [Claviceps purpurea]|nr:hypothetical protein E4U22_001465 [Claviceps purpurea]
MGLLPLPYRHDLESFFYALLWLYECQAWTNEFASDGEEQLSEEDSCFDAWWWSTGVSAKVGQMTIGDLATALDVVKPLCLKIRDILFCLNQDGEMIFGPPLRDPDQLYGPVIAAFDQAISTL